MYSLQSIKDSLIPEGESIDYKGDLSLKSQSEKKEFLYDIASFFNKNGGQIFLGIEEEQGIPKLPFKGFKFPNLDQAKLRIQEMIRDNIEPRILGLQIIDHLFDNKPIIELRIPKGYSRPYAVKQDKSLKFYSRDNNGKYHLNLTEIKQLIMEEGQFEYNIKVFLDERLTEIRSVNIIDDLPQATLVFHLIPRVAFQLSHQLDLHSLFDQIGSIELINDTYCSKHWNIDGIYSSINGSHTQIFRNGIVEATDTYLLNRRKVQPDIAKSLRKPDFIPSLFVEKALIRILKKYINVHSNIGTELPLFIFAHFINARGLGFGGDSNYFELRDIRYSKETLKLVSTKISSFDQNPIEVLMPIFDSMWNAFGYPYCTTYRKQPNAYT